MVPYWQAIFKDNTSLNQYNDKGDEVQFKSILDRLKDLKSLTIHLGEKIYKVFLLDGMFKVDDKCIYILDDNLYPPKQLSNIRPIYFERWQQDFNVSNNKPLPQKFLFTAIGFQANFKDKNVKRYLEVYPSGDIKVREK